MSPRTVLVVGASGFVGARIVGRLLAEGHRVVCAGRDPATLRRRAPSCRAIQVDLAVDDATTWMRRLENIDAVVNAAGTLRGDLEGVQRRGPIALFDACAQIGVPRLVQISALGAGAVETPFLRTKADADAHLLRLARESRGGFWCIVRPSLVIGPGGASTALFTALAALPRPLRLGPGTWRVQPVHVSDLARAVADLVVLPTVPEVIDLVGREPMNTDELTACLRAWLELPPRRPLTVPTPLLRIGAWFGGVLPNAALTPDTLRMLAGGNVGDPAPATAALGWTPRSLADTLTLEPCTPADLLAARMLPIRSALLTCLATVWMWTGLVSFLVPPARADALLGGLGLSGDAALIATRFGALLDLALGLAMLPGQHRTRVLVVQLAVMLAYTALATVAFPSLWLDPFGPLLKNAAVLAAMLGLLATEPAR